MEDPSTLNGCATKVWIPKKMTSVRRRVSTTSSAQPNGARRPPIFASAGASAGASVSLGV